MEQASAPDQYQSVQTVLAGLHIRQLPVPFRNAAGLLELLGVQSCPLRESRVGGPSLR